MKKAIGCQRSSETATFASKERAIRQRLLTAVRNRATKTESLEANPLVVCEIAHMLHSGASLEQPSEAPHPSHAHRQAPRDLVPRRSISPLASRFPVHGMLSAPSRDLQA